VGDRTQQLVQPSERQVCLRLDAGRSEDNHPAFDRGALRLLEQTGLPDPGGPLTTRAPPVRDLGELKGALIPIGGLTSGFISKLARSCTEPGTSSEDLATPGGFRVKGALITIVALTRGFPSGSVWLDGNPGTVYMMADRCLLRSEGETWGPVSLDKFSKQVSAPWADWIPIVAVEAERVERTRRKTDHGPDPRFVCPTPLLVVGATRVRRRNVQTVGIEHPAGMVRAKAVGPR
jgi:hypothetical protein